MVETGSDEFEREMAKDGGDAATVEVSILTAAASARDAETSASAPR
jgi:hypothetical protein